MNADTEYLADPDLTADEQTIIAADKAEDLAAAEALAAANAPPPVADVVADPAPDPVAEALAANAAETRALRERIEADAAARAAEAAALAAANAPPPRDYDAELTAIAKKFEDDDDFTVEDRLAAERAIVRAQAKAEAEAELATKLAEQSEQAAAAQASAEDAKWAAAQAKFFADPGNAALVDGRIKTAGFVAAIEEAAAEGITDYDQILIKAREKITGTPAVDTDKALREAAFNRTKEANAVAPSTLRDVPNTSNPGDNPGAALDNLDISNLEDALAKMSDADRDRFLAGAPGGLQDNPRAA